VASIEDILREEIEGCVARSHEFDECEGWRPMSEVPHTEAPFYRFTGRALRNLLKAEKAIANGEDPTPHLCDAVNVTLLAKSLLPVAPK
jgi:hypothetical protein